ncbi:MAG: prepilin-type N-terminal cleavage/methylation domain-containing protein [Elusimicrobiota bacterium]|jgi:general secretion pathway protein G
MRNQKTSSAAKRGFTLIELMIVVAIIGILAAIAIPKFADLVRKSNEGATKGNLGTIRSALSIYYGDMEGTYPSNPLDGLTGNNGKYLSRIPEAKTPPHHGNVGTFLLSDSASEASAAGGWLFNNVANSSTLGEVHVNCTHTDTRSSVWSSY